MEITNVDDYKLFEAEEECISIKYPAKWHKTEGQMGTIVAFINPENQAISINLLAQPLPADEGNLSIDEFKERSLEELKMSGVDVQVSTSRMFDKSGATFTFDAPMGPRVMRIVQHFILFEGKVYILTYTAPRENSDEHLPTLKQMLRSTKFISAVAIDKKPLRELFTNAYEVPEFTYRIWPPSAWRLDRQGQSTIEITHQGGIHPQETKSYTLKIIVSVTPLPSSIATLDQWSDIITNHLESELDSSLTVSKTGTIASVPAHSVSYSSDSIVKQGIVDQTWFVRNSLVYNITTVRNTSPTDTRALPLFDRFKSLFEFTDKSNTPKYTRHTCRYDHLIYHFGVKLDAREYTPQSGKSTVLLERELSRIVFAVNDLASGKPRDLNDFVKEVEPLLGMSENGKIIENKDIDMLGGVKGRRIVYQATFQGDTVKTEQRCAYKGDRSYIIVFTAPEAHFDSEKRYGEPILNSFDLW